MLICIGAENGILDLPEKTRHTAMAVIVFDNLPKSVEKTSRWHCQHFGNSLHLSAADDWATELPELWKALLRSSWRGKRGAAC
ncbi:MAG: hypothetical protein SFX18_05740 [Pirellulales bacterium]|nr:hypothetical protein [Pirellulales bacterium]